MTHGTRANYRKGCRCEPCAEANRERNRRWYAENKTRYTQKLRDRYAEDPEYRQRRRDLANDWRKKNPEESRALGRRWRSENAEKHRQNARDYYAENKQGYIEREQARRALKAGAEVTPVDLADLWTGYCALCGGEMSHDLEYPDPMSKSLDHDTPLSLGGSHSKENLQWTHLVCNISKGAGTRGETTP